MLPAHISQPRVLAAAVLAAGIAVGLASCGDSPFEPQGVGERVPFGQAITDRVSGDTIRTYSFVAAAGGEYAVELRALEGGVELALVDSVQQAPVNLLWADATQHPTATTAMRSANGGVHLLHVRAVPPGSGPSRFQFQVAVRDVEPEVRSAAFAIGDTVSGETMTSALDVDQFVTSGVSGEEVVAAAEALPGAAGGPMAVRFFDAPAGAQLPVPYSVAPGGPTLLTTGRIPIPATGRLVLRFESSASPTFSGGYRFWTYRVLRAPEHRAAAIPAASVIADERIDRSGDIDEFSFTAAAGAEYNAFIQAARPFRLEMGPQGGQPVVAVIDTVPGDTALFSAFTGTFLVAQAGTWTARVSGPEPVADTGAYRLYVYPVDRRPERIPASVAPGDSVSGEAIDVPGDVDEFTFTAAAGQEFNVFLQARDGSSGTRLQLEAVDADGTVLGIAYSAGTDSALLRQPTGRFAVRTSGSHRLRVRGGAFRPFEGSVGAYRLLLYRVNRAPESVPVTFALGDSVLGESLDAPGDVDEFQVVVPDTTGANLVIALADSALAGSSLSVRLEDQTTQQVVTSASAYQAGVRVLGGRVRLTPGTYVLRVDGVSHDRSLLRGAYRLWLHRFGFGPETVSDTIAIGDTVSGEAIEPLGDADEFTFFATRRAQINVALQGLAGPASGVFRAYVSRTGGAPFAIVSSPAAATSLSDHATLRMALDLEGWYSVSVSAAGQPQQAVELGAYRLAVTPAATAPEVAGAQLAPGDAVTTETLSPPGDMDRYLITAPGAEISVIVTAPTTAGPAVPVVMLQDPANGDSLGFGVASGTTVLGPVPVPAGGQLAVVVYERPTSGFRDCSDATCGGIYRYDGGYQLQVASVNRAPESAPATFVVGDTVRGEAVDPAADIDEFAASGTPGDTLSGWFRLLAAPVPSGGAINPQAVDPATGAVLYNSMTLVGPSQQFSGPVRFVVPLSGTFMIRVRGGSMLLPGDATAPYEFFVKRGL